MGKVECRRTELADSLKLNYHAVISLKDGIIYHALYMSVILSLFSAPDPYSKTNSFLYCRKPEIYVKFARVTRNSSTSFKVKRSMVKVTRSHNAETCCNF